MYNDEDDTPAVPTLGAPVDWHISVTIDRHPAAISRILDPIVRQGVTPRRLTAEAEGEEILVTLEFAALDPQKAERIVALFQTLPAVTAVTWRHHQSLEMGETA